MNRENAVCVASAGNPAIARGIEAAIRDRFELSADLVQVDAGLKIWVDTGTPNKRERQSYTTQLMLFVNGFMRGYIQALTEQKKGSNES